MIKIFLLLTRILGIAAGLLGLFAVGWLLSESYFPIYSIVGEKTREFIWKSIFVDVLPTAILCLLLLLPYSRISSLMKWRWAYALLCAGTVYYVSKTVIISVGEADVLGSLAANAISFCLLISQLCVILIERLRRIRQIDPRVTATAYEIG